MLSTTRVMGPPPRRQRDWQRFVRGLGRIFELRDRNASPGAVVSTSAVPAVSGSQRRRSTRVLLTSAVPHRFPRNGRTRQHVTSRAGASLLLSDIV